MRIPCFYTKEKKALFSDQSDGTESKKKEYLRKEEKKIGDIYLGTKILLPVRGEERGGKVDYKVVYCTRVWERWEEDKRSQASSHR